MTVNMHPTADNVYEKENGVLPGAGGKNKEPAPEGKTFKVSVLAAALVVRLLFVFHSLLAVWRVVEELEDPRYWALMAINIFLVLEFLYVIKRNAGVEWNWWSPCFLCYMVTILPALWIIQLEQNPTPDSESSQNSSLFNATFNNTTPISAFTDAMDSLLPDVASTTWNVILLELLIYFTVFGRWFLPRPDMSRMALAELLMAYLGKASDIMEFYALFDEDIIQNDPVYTYVVLVVWSMSFLQFIPVLTNNQEYRKVQLRCIRPVCSERIAELFDTCSSLFLQDGPFLCIRLILVIKLKLIKYSLIFFILKNILTIVLLLYTLLAINLDIDDVVRGP